MRTSDRWYNRIIRDSRYNDRVAGRIIDPTIQYITSAHLLEFQNKQSNRCYYCQVSLNWMRRRDRKNGLTLERRDNNLPHYLTNCVGLCCKSCNSKRLPMNVGILKRYFSKWKIKALDPYVMVDGLRRGCFVT